MRVQQDLFSSFKPVNKLKTVVY